MKRPLGADGKGDLGPATAKRYIRVSYATSLENLQEAMRRLAIFFATRKA